MNFFVIGGAGYIGSHLVAEARRHGHTCVVYDDLSRGHAQSLPPDVVVVKGDILDTTTLAAALEMHQPQAIFHFAALALVGESVAHPELYYRNNAMGVVSLLDAMAGLSLQVPLVFSSLVVGIAGLGDVRKLGRIGVKSFAYCAVISAISVIIGLTLVNVIQPGKRIDPKTAAGLQERYGAAAFEGGKDVNVRNFDGQPALTEADALIAYIQVLGTMVDFSTFIPDPNR